MFILESAVLPIHLTGSLRASYVVPILESLMIYLVWMEGMYFVHIGLKSRNGTVNRRLNFLHLRKKT